MAQPPFRLEVRRRHGCLLIAAMGSTPISVDSLQTQLEQALVAELPTATLRPMSLAEFRGRLNRKQPTSEQVNQAVLAELAQGQPLSVAALVKRLGHSKSAIRKHLERGVHTAALRVVESQSLQDSGRHYCLADAVIPEPTVPPVDSSPTLGDQIRAVMQAQPNHPFTARSLAARLGAPYGRIRQILIGWAKSGQVNAQPPTETNPFVSYRLPPT